MLLNVSHNSSESNMRRTGAQPQIVVKDYSRRKGYITRKMNRDLYEAALETMKGTNIKGHQTANLREAAAVAETGKSDLSRMRTSLHHCDCAYIGEYAEHIIRHQNRDISSDY